MCLHLLSAAAVQYDDEGRVKSLLMETALAADSTAVAATLQFLPASWLPAAATVFHFATGTMTLSSGERCGVELCWRQQDAGGSRKQRRQAAQHPAAPFPRTVTVCI